MSKSSADSGESGGNPAVRGLSRGYRFLPVAWSYRCRCRCCSCLAARAGFEATGGWTRTGWEVRDGASMAWSSSAPTFARHRLQSTTITTHRRGWVGLVDFHGPRGVTRPTVYHRRASGLESEKGGVHGFFKSHSCAAVGLGSSGLPIDRSSPSGQSPSETEFPPVRSSSR